MGQGYFLAGAVVVCASKFSRGGRYMRFRQYPIFPVSASRVYIHFVPSGVLTRIGMVIARSRVGRGRRVGMVIARVDGHRWLSICDLPLLHGVGGGCRVWVGDSLRERGMG